MGRDRLAFLYLGQAARMVDELSAAYPLNQPYFDEEEAMAVNNTLWRVYNLIAFGHLSRSWRQLLSGRTHTETCFSRVYSTTFMKPLDIKLPFRPRLICNHKSDGIVWEAYPRQTEKEHSHLECILNSLTDLNEINMEATQHIFKDAGRRLVSREEIEMIVYSVYPRLQSWFVDLPRCIQDGQSSVPQILLLQWVSIYNIDWCYVIWFSETFN